MNVQFIRTLLRIVNELLAEQCDYNTDPAATEVITLRTEKVCLKTIEWHPWSNYVVLRYFPYACLNAYLKDDQTYGEQYEKCSPWELSSPVLLDIFLQVLEHHGYTGAQRELIRIGWTA